MTREVACPTCGKPVPWTAVSRWRPFCSERCRLIDLGEWIDESRRIPAEDEPPAEDSVHGAQFQGVRVLERERSSTLTP